MLAGALVLAQLAPKLGPPRPTGGEDSSEAQNALQDFEEGLRQLNAADGWFNDDEDLGKVALGFLESSWRHLTGEEYPRGQPISGAPSLRTLFERLKADIPRARDVSGWVEPKS